MIKSYHFQCRVVTFSDQAAIYVLALHFFSAATKRKPDNAFINAVDSLTKQNYCADHTYNAPPTQGHNGRPYQENRFLPF